MTLAERTKASAWVSAAPGLADAVATWDEQLAMPRAALADRAAELARPGIPPPFRVARQYGAFTVAQLRWLVRRAPLDMFDGGRPLRDPGAWLQGSVAYILRDQLALLGPAAVELARLIGEAEGLTPDVLVDELRRRPVTVAPLPRDTAARLVKASLGGEVSHLGEPFSILPISQLHGADLRDGNDALVRIRRPGAAHAGRQDLRIAATLLGAIELSVPAARQLHPVGLIELAARQMLEEADLRHDALNAVLLGLAIEELSIEGVIVPRPVPGIVARQAIALEDLPGARPLLDQGAADLLDRERAAAALVRLTIEAAFADGTFLADLRPEQFAALPDGRLAIVGSGVCGHFDRRTRRAAIDLIVSLMGGDASGLVAAMDGVGALSDQTDPEQLTDELERAEALRPMTILSGGETGLITALQTAITILLRHRVHPPAELMLFLRSLLSLRALLRVVNPGGTLMDALFPVVSRLPQLRADLADL